jgi:hypothetical protein
LAEGYLLGEDIYPSSNLRRENAMEKTIKYLLQEAYVDGYKDARESIAQEIEKLPVESSTTNAVGMKSIAIKVARGKQ